MSLRRARLWAALMLAAAPLIAGCASGPALLDGNASAAAGGAGAVPANRVAALTTPPADYFVRATSGAKYEIDEETLNGPPIAQADTTLPVPGVMAAIQPPVPPPVPPAAARDDVAHMDVATEQPDGQTVIRAVAVVPVKGAPGSGNQELTDAMRNTLRRAGWAVLDKPRADALTVAGEVGVAQADSGNQRVAVHWSVATPQGRPLGDVKQANAVPAGSLDGAWGDAAVQVAQAAASGIFDMVKRLQ